VAGAGGAAPTSATRTIVALRVDRVEVGSEPPERRRTLSRAEAEAEGWFNGPPYAVAESVFDEYDLEGCSPKPEETLNELARGTRLARQVGARALSDRKARQEAGHRDELPGGHQSLLHAGQRRREDGRPPRLRGRVRGGGLLAPGIGEIIGGSQREERLEVLDRSMAERGIDQEH
jgi:hypothetical protein